MGSEQSGNNLTAPGIRLEVILSPDGREVTVNGPLENKDGCIQMLTLAIQAVLDFQKKKPTEIIQGRVLPNGLIR